MIKSKLLVFLLAFFVSMGMPAMAAGNKAGAQGGQSKQVSATLTQAEEDTLLWMREEEKVARDVYLALYEVWGQSIFDNIASSEQNHMDTILNKIDQYALVDPALPVIGEFSNQALQTLYNQLVAEGSESYVAALTVGATIEDMDINDLLAAIAETDDLGLQNTYQNLLEGSKNHLRAFVGLLRNQGVNYKPQYISQELFDAILGV